VKEIREVTDATAARVICAVPDPHIERWLLVDSAAFKSVLGRGCAAPDQKCEKARYKRLLIEAIRQAGIIPNLGGIEFAADIVAAMNLARASRLDPSLKPFLDEMMAEAFGLDRRIELYQGKRPITLYGWDLDCLVDVMADALVTSTEYPVRSGPGYAALRQLHDRIERLREQGNTDEQG
jgi:hypothetical protein